LDKTGAQPAICVASIRGCVGQAACNALRLTTGKIGELPLREFGDLAVIETGWKDVMGLASSSLLVVCSQNLSGNGLREVEVVRSLLRHSPGRRVFSLLPFVRSDLCGDAFVGRPWLLADMLHCASSQVFLWNDDARLQILSSLASRPEFQAILSGTMHEIGHLLYTPDPAVVPSRIRETQQHWLVWRDGLADAWQVYAGAIADDFLPQLRLFIAEGADKGLLDTLVENLAQVCEHVTSLDEAVSIRSRRLAEEQLEEVLSAIEQTAGSALLNVEARDRITEQLARWRC